MDSLLNNIMTHEESLPRSYNEKKISVFWRLVIIVLAAFLMACNIRILVRTAGTLPGGAAGLTLLIQEICDKFFNLKVSYTLVNLLVNSFPIYIGFRFIGKKFTLYSCVMIFLTGFFTDMIPIITITDDVLLSCVFGGIINGTAISLVLSVDATSGGTDFIGIYLSDKKGMDSFNLVLGINAVILSTAGILFGWDKALYSIIFQYVSTQTLHLLYKKYQKQTLFVVTNKPVDVCDAIRNTCNHTATVLEGEGSYEHCKRNVVYSVVSAAEYQKVISSVKTADPKAFINAIHTDQIKGQFYQRRVE